MCTLTLPLTHVKDEARSVVAVTTPLILVKNEVKYDRYTFTTLLNGSPHVRESMTVLDSGSHPVDSGFRVLDSGFQKGLDSKFFRF